MLSKVTCFCTLLTSLLLSPGKKFDKAKEEKFLDLPKRFLTNPEICPRKKKTTELITPEIPAKGRKQSLPKNTLFTIIPRLYLLFWHVILR